MRIVICVHNLANGGAERVAALWATGFAERGDDVVVVLAEKDAPIEYSISSKVQIINIWKDGYSLVRYIRKLLKLRLLLRKLKPDIAIAVMQPWSEWLLLTTIGLNIKVVNTEHNSFERPVSSPMAKEMRFRKFWLNRLFPAVTVLTEADRKVLSCKIKHVYKLPNPLAFEPYYNIQEKEKIVLAAGRLDMWYVKGFDLLIEAWSKVSFNYPDWKLYIVGRGEETDEQRISGWIKEKNLQDSIMLMGFSKDILNYYKKAEIFVLSSRYEGFGMVLIEAMSQGCAPIAANFNGRASEIITKQEEGILCGTDDSSALASALTKLLSDEDYRHSLQEGAFKRSKSFQINNIISKWDKVFKDLGLSTK